MMDIFIYSIDTLYRQEYTDVPPIITGFAIKFRAIPSEQTGLSHMEGRIEVDGDNLSFNEAKDMVLKIIKGQ